MDTTTPTSTIESVAEPQADKSLAVLESQHDMRDALLMASLAGNLFMVALWVTVKATGLSL